MYPPLEFSFCEHEYEDFRVDVLDNHTQRKYVYYKRCKKCGQEIIDVRLLDKPKLPPHPGGLKEIFFADIRSGEIVPSDCISFPAKSFNPNFSSDAGNTVTINEPYVFHDKFSSFTDDHLQEFLMQAIAQEDYELCAEIRDELVRREKLKR